MGEWMEQASCFCELAPLAKLMLTSTTLLSDQICLFILISDILTEVDTTDWLKQACNDPSSTRTPGDADAPLTVAMATRRLRRSIKVSQSERMQANLEKQWAGGGLFVQITAENYILSLTWE